jgi:hypothetical protein
VLDRARASALLRFPNYRQRRGRQGHFNFMLFVLDPVDVFIFVKTATALMQLAVRNKAHQ